MFDVGFSEWLVIALVALIVLGPKRLPHAARVVGALLRRIRSHWSSLRETLAQELDADSLRNDLARARHTIAQMDDRLKHSQRQLTPHSSPSSEQNAPLPPSLPPSLPGHEQASPESTAVSDSTSSPR